VGRDVALDDQPQLPRSLEPARSLDEPQTLAWDELHASADAPNERVGSGGAVTLDGWRCAGATATQAPRVGTCERTRPLGRFLDRRRRVRTMTRDARRATGSIVSTPTFNPYRADDRHGGDGPAGGPPNNGRLRRP
jgi:hypothetical protein